MGRWKRIGTFGSHPHLFLQLLFVIAAFFDNEGLDAMVTVWLASKRNPKSWNVFDDAGRVLSETAVNDKESVDLSSTTLG